MNWLGIVSLLLAASSTPPRLSLTPCQFAGVPQEARCGTYEVFENREARTGRKIALGVAVLPPPRRLQPAGPRPLRRERPHHTAQQW